MATIIISIIMALSVQTQDMALVGQVAQEYDLPVQYVGYCDWDAIESRTSDYLLVEVVESTGDGTRYGTDEGGYTLAYNQVVPAGKQVTSYVIYNPYTQIYDDVVYVVDNGMIR